MTEYIKHDALKVYCNVPIKEVESLTLQERYSDHVKAELTAAMEYDKLPILQADFQGQPIKIYAEWKQEKILLFHGTICEFGISKQAEFLTVQLSCVSVSFLMDLEKKSRSFQDTKETILTLIERIAKEHEFCVISPVTDQNTNGPFIQYEETDWTFIKRLASHLSAPVIAAGYFQNKGISIGMSDGYRGTELRSRTQKWRMEPEQIQYANWKTEEAAYYEVDTGTVCHVGDCVMYQGQYLWVYKADMVLQSGRLECTYQLAAKEYRPVIPYGSDRLKGISLPGTVLDRNAERIKIHLDIDEQQNPETAHWYPWMPEHGNLLYCMPETGTKIRLLVPEREEREAMAIHTIRQNGASCEKTQSPSGRWFMTPTEKYLTMQPDHLELFGPADESGLVIQDGIGNRVTSKKEMVVKAMGSVRMQANRVMLQAPKEVTAVKRNLTAPTVLNLCHKVDAVGGKSKFISRKGPAVKKPTTTFIDRRITQLAPEKRKEFIQKEQEKLNFRLKELVERSEKKVCYDLGAAIVTVISAIPQATEADPLCQISMGFRTIAGTMKGENDGQNDIKRGNRNESRHTKNQLIRCSKSGNYSTAANEDTRMQKERNGTPSGILRRL